MSDLESTANHGSRATPPPVPDQAASRPRLAVVPIAIGAGVAVTIAAVVGLVLHAESKTNNVAMSASPAPVTVVSAAAVSFRDSRTYVGTLRPWVEASVGPQFLSAYVDTVLVRPGATVKRGEVLATLDCRNASASSQAVAAEARAIGERQKEVADESSRLNTLLDGGFVSIVETQQKQAQAASEDAQLAAQRAKLISTNLTVSDCVMRAPFDGEVAVRTVDPGAFVRPGTPIVSVVDRDTVRMTFDVPEADFDAVAVSTPARLRLVATGRTLETVISRRSPSADPDTRTVHVECDVPDPQRVIPVNTTGEVRIEVGSPVAASAVPLYAASISGHRATVFVVEGGVAHRKVFEVLGEQGSDLFFETALKPGTQVVTEGRTALKDGASVTAVEKSYAAATASANAHEGKP